MELRPAVPADAPEIIRITNAAYVVERSFIDSERIDAEETSERFRDGVFLVLDDAGRLAGSVWVELRPPDRAYFGLLAVDPSRQKEGLGRRLVTAAESWALSHGRAHMDLQVVNLRTELPPYYRRLGYTEYATAPFSDPRLLQPAHFILMTKKLPPLHPPRNPSP